MSLHWHLVVGSLLVYYSALLSCIPSCLAGIGCMGINLLLASAITFFTIDKHLL